MNLNRYKIYFFLVLLSILNLNSYSQYYLYYQAPQNIDISFLKKSIETESNLSFFNLIKIKNNSSNSEELTLSITVPDGWKVIGQEKIQITINPLDSILIPIRVSVHGKVKGDIGYSVVASLSDNRGNTIKNEYCFIKIKRSEDLKISIPMGFNYFDQRTGLSEFSVKVSNNGNREELINFIFELESGLSFGETFLENYSTDITIPPFTDTTFTYFVKLKESQIEGKETYKLSFRAKSNSKLYTKSIWFRLLKSDYINYISSSEKSLVLDFIAQGLMSEGRKPNYAILAQGKTLLKKDNDIYYYYRNLSSKNSEDFYINNRMYLGVNLKNWNLEIGDTYMNLESSLIGRGISIGYIGESYFGRVIANKSPSNNNENFGGIFGVKLTKSAKVESSISYNNNYLKDIKSIIGSVSFQVKIKKHSFQTMGAINSLHQFYDNKNEHIQYSWNFKYSFSNKKLINNLSIRYGSPFYYGHHKGQLLGSLLTTYTLRNNHRITFFSIVNENKNPFIQNYLLQYYNINNSINNRLLHSWDISPKVNLFYGPGFEQNLRNFSQGNILFANNFTTRVFNLQVGSRFKFDDPYTSVSPKFTIGNVNVVDYPKLFGNNPSLYSNVRNFNIYYFDINFRSKKWSLITSYESGPKNINTQFNYFFISRTTRNLRVMPSFNSFIYKNIIRLDASAAYNNDMVLKNSYLNTSFLFTFFLPREWSVRANAFYSFSNRTTSDGVEKYNSLYLEAGVRKEFNMAHPRVSFHNLNIIVFKDFNGNRIQEANEPGLKNIMVTITKEHSSLGEVIPGNINSIDLLTNYIGHVSFENIPNGLYKIEYNPIGKDAGTFSKVVESLNVNINKNQTILIPFVEKNKVFGKIVLNRSKLSGLGKVDFSNIRITATDSRGNTFSTLTDKNGEFIIFAPVTDEYIVNINNIFYENFDLRQNNFRVQFNGYKQFEVNFVFDEKIRRINFSPSTQDNLAEGVLQIRRTNLRGTIKDATSLKPLRARINLVNTKNNSIASSVYSNPQTGDYALSFMAEDIYVLEILADDYWYFSENLTLNQVTTFMNVNKDILLKQITIGSKIELNIKFLEINKAALGPETVAELNRLLRILRDNSNIKIEVQGHCDDLEALNNPQIAEERAKAVAKYLIENGFNNLQVRGFGNTVPVAPNDTEENRTLNRRVELEVISK